MTSGLGIFAVDCAKEQACYQSCLASWSRMLVRVKLRTIHVCMIAFMYVCMYACVYMYVCVYTYLYIYICMHYAHKYNPSTGSAKVPLK